MIRNITINSKGCNMNFDWVFAIVGLTVGTGEFAENGRGQLDVCARGRRYLQMLRQFLCDKIPFFVDSPNNDLRDLAAQRSGQDNDYPHGHE